MVSVIRVIVPVVSLIMAVYFLSGVVRGTRGPGSLSVCLERRLIAVVRRYLHDPGKRAAPGLLIVHVKGHGLVVKIFGGEVLADGQLPVQYGLGIAAGLGRPSRPDTERGRAEDRKGLALEALVEDLEDPPEVGAILSLAALVLDDLVLRLYFDQRRGVGSGDVLRRAGRGK